MANSQPDGAPTQRTEADRHRTATEQRTHRNQNDKLLEMLRCAGSDGVTTWQTWDAGIHHCNSRVSDLRGRGLHITRTRVGPGNHRYVLHEAAQGTLALEGHD
jgi:hypothetical protein